MIEQASAIPVVPLNGWTQHKVDVHSEKDFRISIQVTASSAGTYLALDDIKYTAGPCNSGRTQTTVRTTLATVEPKLSLSCDFESFTMCNWKNERNWQISTSKYISALLPVYDHTKENIFGKYVYLVHTSLDGMSQKTAVMSAVNNQWVSGSVPFCLTLWYYMRSTSGYIRLNITIASPNGVIMNSIIVENDQGEKWKQLKIEAQGDKNGYIYQIEAIAKLGKFIG